MDHRDPQERAGETDGSHADHAEHDADLGPERLAAEYGQAEEEADDADDVHGVDRVGLPGLHRGVGYGAELLADLDAEVDAERQSHDVREGDPKGVAHRQRLFLLDGGVDHPDLVVVATAGQVALGVRQSQRNGVGQVQVAEAGARDAQQADDLGGRLVQRLQRGHDGAPVSGVGLLQGFDAALVSTAVVRRCRRSYRQRVRIRSQELLMTAGRFRR